MRDKVQAIINTGHLRHNLAQVRALAPHSKILAVIKANAYGHGILETANALQEADAFAVAHLDEAIMLRTFTSKNIVVLEGFVTPADWLEFQQHQLTPVIHAPYQTDIVVNAPPAAACQLWLKMDTGMHRLGLEPGNFQSNFHALKTVQPGIDIIAMTHFASAEETGNLFTSRQISQFDAIAASLRVPASLANSAGIVCWPNSHRDWVRPGLMLYGVSPVASATTLHPVMTLQSQVIALHKVNKGEGVGYNGRWIAPYDALIATVAAGYADGYPTQVPDGTPVLVNGHKAAIAGRPSMDMLTVDVTGLANINIGDDVVLWGEGLPIDQIATRSGTIAYQLLTGVSPRVKRIYK